MRTVFDKARENASAFGVDFVHKPIFDNPDTPIAKISFALCHIYTDLISRVLGDYGSKNVTTSACASAYDRFQFKFIINHETTDAEYVGIMRFWNDIDKWRDKDYDGILVTTDENNLPLISCNTQNLREVLWQLCKDHGLLKYYAEYFAGLDTCLERLALGEGPRLH